MFAIARHYNVNCIHCLFYFFFFSKKKKSLSDKDLQLQPVDSLLVKWHCQLTDKKNHDIKNSSSSKWISGLKYRSVHKLSL